MTQNARQRGDILQIELIAGVIFGDQQRVARFGADFFHRRHRRLHAQRMKIRVQIIETAGIQIGVHRRQFETAVTQINRAVKRRRVLQPLAAQPMFNGDGFIEYLALQTERRTGQGSGKSGYG